MASRRVLQEILISTPTPENQAEEEGNVPLFYHKQPPSPSNWISNDISNEECKENMVPVDCGNFTKEKYENHKLVPEISQESERSVHSKDCEDAVGRGHCSQSDSEGNKEATQNYLAPLQLERNKDKEIKTNEGDSCSTPLRDGEGSDQSGEMCRTPMDFSKVSVSDLGISAESLTKFSGKSPKSLLKHRRRSTIGVRGSPEMNFLIRQIAQQRSKMKSETDPVANPFVSPRNSLLKDKISAFRNAFQVVEENEGKLSLSGFSEKTKSQSESVNGEEPRAEPPKKKRRACSIMDPIRLSAKEKHCPSGFLTEEDTENFDSCVQDQMNNATEYSLDSGNLPDLSVSKEVQPAPLFHSDDAPSRTHSPKCLKRKVVFANHPNPELYDQSLPPVQPLVKDSVPTIPSSGQFLRPVLKKTPRREVPYVQRFAFCELGEEKRLMFSPLEKATDHGSCKNSVKKKHVTFGRELSPEVFDRTLPANTPLRRGGTPYNHHISSTTPDTEEKSTRCSLEPLPQPDFDFSDDETLQPVSLCFEAESDNSATPSPGHDNGPSKEADYGTPESREDVPMLDDAVLFSPSLNLSFPDTSSTVLQSDTTAANETRPLTPESTTPPARSRVTRSTLKRKSCSSEENTSSQTEVTSKGPLKGASKKDKKQVRVVSKKTQVKAPRGKGKKSRGRPKKSVQRPVYVERETVSKKPLLSPIPEVPECYPTPPASMFADFLLGKTLDKPVDKECVKKLPKKKKGRRSSGNTQDLGNMFILNDSCDHSVAGKEKTDLSQGAGQIISSDQDCPEQDSCKMEYTDVITNDSSESQVTSPALDSLPQATCPRSESEYCLYEKPMTEKQTEKPNLELDNHPSISVEMEVQKAVCDVAIRNCSKRRSTHRKSMLKHAVEEESSLPKSGKPEVHSVCGSQGPEESTENLQPMSNELANSLDNKKVEPAENSSSSSAINEAVLPFTSGAVGSQKSRRSSRNLHRVTIFCLPPTDDSAGNNPTNIPPNVSPNFGENAENCNNDLNFCFDEPLQYNKKEKKVRRSMRLRRDSGTNGLSWVQEEKGREETGRRRSVCLSMVKPLENPKMLLEGKIYSPIKENQKEQPAPSMARKSRRRTLGTTTIQEVVSVRDTKLKDSKCFYKDFPISHSQIETVQSVSSQDI